MVSETEFRAALRVLERKVGAYNSRYLKKVTAEMLAAAEEVRIHDPWPEPNMRPRAEE